MKKLLIIFSFGLFFSIAQAISPWLQKCSMGGLGRHLACSMSIGARGYVGGGWDGVNVYYDFWEYDPATNSWTQKADLPFMLWSNPCFGIDTAGYAAAGSSTWMFRPTANTWTNVNSSAPSGTYMEEAKWVINGKGYTIDQNYIYEFDPQTFQWTIKYNLPANNFACDAGFMINGKCYLIDNYYHKFYEYDPSANTFLQKAACPLINTSGTSFAVNGKGYTGLGFVQNQVGSTQSYVEYDPLSDSWRGINDFTGTNRRKATAFVIGNHGYVTCGSSGTNMNDLWEFNSDNVSAVDEISGKDNIIIFPNPSADGIFYLEKNANKTARIELFNVNGDLLKEFQVNAEQPQLDLRELPNGNYFLLFFFSNGPSVTKKISISK